VQHRQAVARRRAKRLKRSAQPENASWILIMLRVLGAAGDQEDFRLSLL
jgi:hypothetical protein